MNVIIQLSDSSCIGSSILNNERLHDLYQSSDFFFLVCFPKEFEPSFYREHWPFTREIAAAVFIM